MEGMDFLYISRRINLLDNLSGYAFHPLLAFFGHSVRLFFCLDYCLLFLDEQKIFFLGQRKAQSFTYRSLLEEASGG